MKKMAILALLGLFVSVASAQTTISDTWSTGITGNDGRDGWQHNLRFTGDWTRNPQGDIGSAVTRFDDAGNGVLRAFERASGSEDRFVAPSKFTGGINGGNWSALQSVTLTYRLKTVIPTAAPTAANRLGIQIAIASGNNISTTILTEANALLPTGFYDALNQWYTVTVDLKNAANFVVTNSNPEDPVGSHEQVLGAVDAMLLDIDMISGTETHYIDDVTITYDDGSGPQTVVSNFTDPGNISNDGREGWRRNRVDDGFTPTPQGDPASAISFKDGFLTVVEAGQGAGDWFVAPDRYLVNGGRFNGLASASFTFDYTRRWPETVTVANRNGVLVRLYSGTRFVQFDAAIASLPSDFFDVSGVIANIFTPDLFSGQWTVSPANTPINQILNNVTAILIDGEVVNGREINAMDNFNFTYTLRKKMTGNVQFDGLSSNSPTVIQVDFVDANDVVIESQWANVDASGNYETYLPLTAGTYDVRFRAGTPFLTRKVNGIVAGANDVTGVNPALLLSGDINGDNEVGAADFSALAAAYDAVLGDANYSAAADLNRDEEVGAADFSILAARYDEVGE